jgi:hypothetical protein
MSTDGLLGPNYVFADQLTTPSELGISRSGSFEGVLRAAAGVNYYTDAIGFGQSTMLANAMGMGQHPLGLRFFLPTGQICSNGADMYEYVDNVPQGMPGKAGEVVKNTIGVELRGMAPGILEDSVTALNPLPVFKAVMASGYAKCKKATLPVGDEAGRIASPFDSSDVWIKSPTRLKSVGDGQYKGVSGGVKPHQTRWVLDSYISQDEYAATPKTEQAGVLPVTEGFSNPDSSKLAAGILFALVLFGVVLTVPKN